MSARGGFSARRLLVAALALAFALGVAAPAQAEYQQPCPEDWTEMDPAVGRLVQFCGQVWMPDGHPDESLTRYVYKAKAWDVTQRYELEDPRYPPPVVSPEFEKYPVRAWARRLIRDEGMSLVLNGGFFTRNILEPTSQMSFPFFTGWNNMLSSSVLLTAGKHPKFELLRDDRRCLSWDRNSGTTVRSDRWTWPDDDFWAINREVLLTGPCTASGTNGEFLVGADPYYEISGVGVPEMISMVGRARTGMLPRWDTLCFFSGGWQTFPEAADVLREFGCEPVLTLDSGKSTGLSFQFDGRQADPLYGYGWDSNRYVPHVIAIR